MQIKIMGHDQDRLNVTITAIMNLACVAFRKGNIPNPKEMQEPTRRGLYWYENEKENKFELLATANNHFAHIKERGKNYIIIEFFDKYDIENKKVNALSNLVLAFFDKDEVQAV